MPRAELPGGAHVENDVSFPGEALNVCGRERGGARDLAERFGAAVLPRRVARGQKPPAPIEGLSLDEIGHLADLVAPFAAQTVRKKERKEA